MFKKNNGDWKWHVLISNMELAQKTGIADIKVEIKNKIWAMSFDEIKRALLEDLWSELTLEIWSLEEQGHMKEDQRKRDKRNMIWLE